MLQNVNKKITAAKCMTQKASYDLISYLWCMFPLNEGDC